jgi:HEAT repeat protein
MDPEEHSAASVRKEGSRGSSGISKQRLTGSWRLRRSAGAAVALGLLVCWPSPAPSETLSEFLDSGALKNTTNPIAINYFLEQAPPTLPEAERKLAMEQIQTALRRQTSAMGRLMEGAIGAMSSPTTAQINQQAQKSMTPTGILMQMAQQQFGVGWKNPTPTQRQQAQVQQEVRQEMTDPWIRGIESAHALEKIGQTQAAARFYMNGIQSLPPDWLSDGCLEGILAMGPQRAYALLSWIVGNAESAALGGKQLATQNGQTSPNVIWLRGAALRGLGVLVDGSGLALEQREQAVQLLLTYSRGSEHAAYFADAAAGLGRSRDPRGVAPLRDLADRKKDPAVALAALQGLAVGFKDRSALRKLRGWLDDDSTDVQLKAANALLAAGDDAGYDWALDVITSKRDADSSRPDIRPRVVRDLVARHDDRARRALQQALHQGAGNDWLAAWIAMGLLEMGDRSQLEAARAAVHKTDWTLDRRGAMSVWREISPLVSAAAQAALTGTVDVKRATRVVANMIASEQARAVERKTDRNLVSLQMKWQACDAFATVDDPAASAELVALLSDPEPSVRLSAARSLAFQPGNAAVDGIVKAFHADFGAEADASRTPEVRAALLRAALSRAPNDPRTRQLAQDASQDADAGVRFIGLLALATN